ncbi:MAG: InlB B-repeat-containing protein [Dysgonamonadaceae bacterium]|jgi:uncharacterized repeat protein (TIGR02543 family)|nr:InlB B-repeat-containing protein [Dysgonamonadaceae bacterium]
MKKIFFILGFALLAISMKVLAGTNPPIFASTNTGEGAVWYHIFWDGKPIHEWRLEGGLWVSDNLENEKLNEYLFCFVGNNEDGYEIYNKAYLRGCTVPTESGSIVLDRDLKLQNTGKLWSYIAYSLLPPADNEPLIYKWFIWWGEKGEVVEGRDVEGKGCITAYKDGNGGWWNNGSMQWGASQSGWGGANVITFRYVSGNIPVSKYSVTVVNGTANVEEALTGETITVTANEAPSGYVFDAWTSDDVTFANAVSKTTTFIMPAKDVTVSATYKSADDATVLLPVSSENTGDKAIWYIINWDCGGDGIRTWDVSKPDGSEIGIDWGGANPDKETQLFCFSGNNADGYIIYNKAFLAGKMTGETVLSEDLKLQNLSAGDWSLLGFTQSSLVSGEELIDKWFIEIGEGQQVEGGPAKEGQAVIYNGNYAWWKSGGSQLEKGTCRNWAGAYGAIFQRITPYFITVANGTANYAQANGGETVTVTANAAPEGYEFDAWTSADVTFDDASSETTTFVMPTKDITVSATYKSNVGFSAPQTLKPAITISGKEVSVAAAANETIYVYAANGSLIKQTKETHFTLEPGFYIVKAGAERVKTVIR